MGLSPSGRLGPYEVVGPLGAGGMGEVYRAHDARLGRDVAIKVLTSHLSTNRDALARFEREARAVAALSHPNILAIHDFGTEEGTSYAVMELLEGETLRERLARSPIPWQRAVATAIQIADGLAAAHAKGVVHRDLKPENVFLTASGQAKILDFGLARVSAATGPLGAATVGALTQPGTLMGTVGYMSPEQVRGEDAGPSTDIFAFGCVLYEMLVGRGPFTRDTAAESLAAVLRDDPAPLAGEGRDVPAALDGLVAHCLERRAQDRFQSASDMAYALRALGGTSTTGAVTVPAVKQTEPHARQRRWRVATGVVVGLALGALASWAWWRMAAPEAPPVQVVRLSLTLPADGPLAPNDSPVAGSSVAISRDGRWVSYLALREGQRHLVVRGLDRFQEQVFAGTEGALAPFFSPDGQWIAFFTETALMKVPLTGGTPTTVCATPPVTRGGVWAENGTIYFSPDFSRGIQGVAATGGHPKDVTTVDLAAGESNHLLPDVLPGATALLYTVWKGGDFGGASVWSVSLRTGERKPLLESAAAPRYVSPGFLVFARAGALFAVGFAADRLAITGEPVPVVDGVWNDRATGTAHYAVAQDGTVVYVPGGSTVERRRLVIVDRQGRAQPLPAEPNFYGTLRLSPDGRRIAVEALNDLWIYDIGNATLSRATFRGTNQHPVWDPDGRHVTFSSSQGAVYPKLFRVDVDAGGQPEQLTRGGGVQFPSSWSPDGGVLAFSEAAVEPADTETGIDVWVWRPRGTPPASVLLQTPFKEDQAAFSPDGRALAYVSDETGQLQAYVRGFPDAGRRTRVSIDGGTEPVWSRRNDELFYRNGRQYLSVPVTTKGGEIRVGRPSLMFEGDFAIASLIPGFPSYDVMPDGQRFVMVARAGDTPRPLRLDVVLGWTSELGRRLASRATP